jgi:phosphohistidine phosphatase
LTLIRHAKSSWDDARLADYDRPLSKRGVRDLPVIGQALAARSPAPDLVVSSPACRACETAVAVAEAFGLDPAHIVTHDRVYDAELDDLLAVIRGLDSSRSNVFLVGHNPGLFDLTEALTGRRLPKLATCGVVMMKMPLRDWSEVRPGCAELVDHFAPKDLEEAVLA